MIKWSQQQARARWKSTHRGGKKIKNTNLGLLVLKSCEANVWKRRLEKGKVSKMCVFFLENGEKKASITLQPEINLHYSKVFSLASRVNTKNAAKGSFQQNIPGNTEQLYLNVRHCTNISIHLSLWYTSMHCKLIYSDMSRCLKCCRCLWCFDFNKDYKY